MGPQSSKLHTVGPTLFGWTWVQLLHKGRPQMAPPLVKPKCFYFTFSHTKGHISYFISSKGEEDPAVFTGDTLFKAGCGKFFEGTAEQMYQSLFKTLSSLPKTTRIYCGHEYTEKNLRFALTVEPENDQIKQKLSWVKHQREANQPTVPSTIEDEMSTNPFMRVDLPELQNRVGCSTPVEALQEIRRMKDNWRG